MSIPYRLTEQAYAALPAPEPPATLTQRITAALNEAQRNWDRVHDDRCDWLRTRGESLCDCVWGGKDGRVLALIAADRRVLERHGKPNDHLTSRFEQSYYGCPRCFGAWPCDELLDLAARWGVAREVR